MSHYWESASSSPASANPTKSIKENWYLSLLAISPTHQGRGIGARLVQQGLQWAKEEGVTASVIAAPKAEVFYKRQGFERVGLTDVGQLGKVGIEPAVIMFLGEGRGKWR